jgi:glycyl-tRNA synthetase
MVRTWRPLCTPASPAGASAAACAPYDSPAIPLADAADYAVQMRAHRIVLSVDERRAHILAGAAALAAAKGGVIPDDSGLLDEVTNLVESPTPFMGRFEERFLALPDDVLVAVMRKHQRYFPVYGKNGRLLPLFIAVRNGDDQRLDVVIDGNEHVIRARFADAEFFYGNDVKRKLPEFLPDLDKLTFQVDLGSMLDKTRRLEQLTPVVAEMLGLDANAAATAVRAAALAKADLATSMVVEMTSLQGVMGGLYARLSGEPEDVAAAIAEQYAAVSRTRPGLALGAGRPVRQPDRAVCRGAGAERLQRSLCAAPRRAARHRKPDRQPAAFRPARRAGGGGRAAARGVRCADRAERAGVYQRPFGSRAA